MAVRSTLISDLFSESKESTLQQKLAAAIIHNNKRLTNTFCNSNRNTCRGNHISSLHAEARVLINFYGNKIYFNKRMGWSFCDPKFKPKKIDLVVVRSTIGGALANARPCRCCTSMMRRLRVRKVHYSTGDENEIISEDVKKMISIQDSSSMKYFERFKNNFPKNDNEYYKYILKKSVPKVTSLDNILLFIKYNLNILLPGCKYLLKKEEKFNFFQILDENDDIIISIKFF